MGNRPYVIADGEAGGNFFEAEAAFYELHRFP
jgi:hypothetical protein